MEKLPDLTFYNPNGYNKFLQIFPKIPEEIIRELWTYLYNDPIIYANYMIGRLYDLNTHKYEYEILKQLMTEIILKDEKLIERAVKEIDFFNEVNKNHLKGQKFFKQMDWENSLASSIIYYIYH